LSLSLGVLAYMATYRLGATRDTVTDVFCRDYPPVLTVSPGDTVVVRSLDASGYLARQQHPGDRQPTMLSATRGHCLTGPIAVRGALPGMVLSVRFVSVRPDDWGWTVAVPSDDRLKRRLGLAEGPLSWLLWDLDIDKGTGTNDLGHTVALAPFLGVVGMPPDEPGEHSTKPPRTRGGGNIDCRAVSWWKAQLSTCRSPSRTRFCIWATGMPPKGTGKSGEPRSSAR
jgi:acetamidase/formamidase